ncbi:MAG: superoxide dismutase [Rhodospirillaceae bacterium]
MSPRDLTHGPFTLPPLPFAEDALAPVISAKTLSFHHGKHHKGYVDKLNELVKDTAFADMALEEIVAATHGDDKSKKIFNNAAQVWNHSFYWNCLSPKATQPSKDLGDAIARDFGSLEALKKELKAKSTDHFGSGWGWLVIEGGKLKVTDTRDAETPLAAGAHGLLTVDVWEHAYYLDYQNARKDHVDALVEKLLNWDFASRNFAQAR